MRFDYRYLPPNQLDTCSGCGYIRTMANKTGQKGDAAQLLLSSIFVEAGLYVFQPVSESLRYDLLITQDHRHFFKMQVKRASPYLQSGRFSIQFRSITVKPDGNHIHKYTLDEVDYICGVVMQTADVYVFPMTDILGRSSIQVDPLISSKNTSQRRILDPELYRNIIVLDGTECKLGRS